MSRLLLVVFLVGCACSPGGTLGHACSTSGDCASELVCVYRYCELPCVTAADCSPGVACTATPSGGVCHGDTFADSGAGDAGTGDSGADDAALDADTGAAALDGASVDTDPFDGGHPLPRGVLGGCIGTGAACVIASDHDVYCWGSAENGVLGTTCVDTRVQTDARRIAGVGGVDALACGDGFVCAHESAGRMLCWGRNDVGQLGRETTTTCEPTPAPVLDDTLAPLVVASADLAAAGAHACVLDLTHGSILCWGRDDRTLDVRMTAPPDRVYLHASDAMQPLRDAPTLTGGAFVTQLAVSATGASARTTSRDLYLWGANDELQTALTAGARYTAVLSVGAGRGAFAVAGRVHRCALDGVGAVCWGSDAHGQLGHAPSASASTCTEGPCEGPGTAMGTFTSIATSGDGDTTCGVVTGGAAVRCWGDNAHGLAGVPASSTPVAYLDGSTGAITFPGAMRLPFSRVFVGPRAACAIDGAQIAWCWGDHDMDPRTTDVIDPVERTPVGP